MFYTFINNLDGIFRRFRDMASFPLKNADFSSTRRLFFYSTLTLKMFLHYIAEILQHT